MYLLHLDEMDDIGIDEVNGFIPNIAYIAPPVQSNNFDGYQNGNNADYALMGVISVLIVILFCLICIGIYSMVGIGCYMFGKSQRNNRGYRYHHKQEDEEAAYYEVEYIYILYTFSNLYSCKEYILKYTN